MTEKTTNFQFTKLLSGESIHADEGRFPYEDRDLMDAALHHLMNHHHTGDNGADDPDTAITAVQTATGGTIPGGVTYHYTYTFTDPLAGETLPAPLATITTPDQLAAPPAPTAVVQALNGSLNPGTYYYVLTRYVTSSTIETLALNPVEVTIPGPGDTNAVVLTMPSLSGATGFNVYRRAPGQSRYLFVGSTTTATFTDTGLGFVAADMVAEWDGGIVGTANAERSLPTVNTTNATSRVTLTLPVALPTNNSWTIYRSTEETNWKTSFLAVPATGQTSFVDTGISTQEGSPPSSVIYHPEKILLTGGAEVQGTLPIANVDFVIDEDDMISDSATKVPTQQSVKAYLTTTMANKADLVSGVVPTSQMPSISIMNRVAVATQAARLALVNPTNVQVGDVAVQADTGVTWLLIDTDPSVAANWKAIDQSDVVQSVNSQTGTVVLGKADVGLGNVDNTSDANKPVSTAQQTALDLKANLASPTFTGTVGGITKTMVGLGNVDNTSDAAKPVSTAQQAALDGKVDKSGGWELNGQATDKTLATYVADAETTAFATTLTDPADAPADADALREDLVANAFPQLRQALTDLDNLRVAYENLRTSHEDLRGIVAALVTAIDNGT